MSGDDDKTHISIAKQWRASFPLPEMPYDWKNKIIQAYWEGFAIELLCQEGETMPDDGKYVELEDCYCVAATGKALLINYQGKEFWVPRSCIIEEGSTVEEKHDTGCVIIKSWFARKLSDENDLKLV